MADKVAIIPKKLLYWRSKVYRKGERVMVDERTAKVLVSRGRAVMEIEHAPAPTPAPVPEPEVEAPKAKRAYKRRDIAPAVTTVMTPEAEDPAPMEKLRSRFGWPIGSATDDDEPGA